MKTNENEICEMTCGNYRDLETAVAAIKRGEKRFAGSLNLAVDLNDVGYDCQFDDGTIIVIGYETTDSKGNIYRIIL